MSNMKNIKEKLDFGYLGKAFFCIIAGTALGLITYIIFLKLNIAIFGWNLGLIFAPLIAGYVETVLANRLIGENLGAISAFILFVDTTIYSLIIKNPSLGFNFITIGSVFVILQAAFPTLINHIILVVVGGTLSRIIKKYKKIVKTLKYYFKKRPFGHWDSSTDEIITNIVPYFNEEESNYRLNNLDFFFITSSDMKDKKHEIIGIYQSDIILEKNKNNLELGPEKAEKMTLMRLKEGKDKCLVKLASKIKENGGNGILDLSMNYSLSGFGGDCIQITAIGVGINIKD